MPAVAVEAIGVTKRFGAFTALADVSFKVAAGTVHGLLGENGAGKSTLVKCLLGYHQPDDGSFLVDGREVAIGTPQDADRLGLGMVYQHFTLVPSMTIAENLVMARADVPQIIAWRSERSRLDEFMRRMPIRVPIDVPAGRLAAGERQKAEILKQLYLNRRLIVLDEPTSTLTPGEAVEVLEFIRQLVDAGEITVIIITHKLKEVAAFADDVTVLRRGRLAGGGRKRDLDAVALTALMIGENPKFEPLRRRGQPADAPLLMLRDLSTSGDVGRAGLDIQSLTVRAGEIVGVAGVSGNGQKDLVETLSGQRAADGTIVVAGRRYNASRAEAQTQHVRILPEEPLKNACVPRMSVVENLNLRQFDRDVSGRRRFWLDRAQMATRATEMIASFGVRTPSNEAPIRNLSGGNVQRVALARELGGDVKLLVIANPCFGLDVKAAADVRARIVAARNAGTAVLLISEDLDEIIEMADRILVMREGRLVYETSAEAADVREIGGHMVGHA
jgi:simple sugar transport system ATP-binding protein